MKRQSNLTENQVNIRLRKKQQQNQLRYETTVYFSSGFKNRIVKHWLGIAYLHTTAPDKCIHYLPRSITINQVYDSEVPNNYIGICKPPAIEENNQTVHCIYINTILILCSGSKWIIWKVQKVEFLKEPIHVNRQN